MRRSILSRRPLQLIISGSGLCSRWSDRSIAFMKTACRCVHGGSVGRYGTYAGGAYDREIWLVVILSSFGINKGLLFECILKDWMEISRLISTIDKVVEQFFYKFLVTRRDCSIKMVRSIKSTERLQICTRLKISLK